MSNELETKDTSSLVEELLNDNEDEQPKKSFFSKFFNYTWIVLLSIGGIILYILKSMSDKTNKMKKEQKKSVEEYKQDIKNETENLTNMNKNQEEVLINIRKDELKARDEIKNVDDIQNDVINSIDENDKTPENKTIEKTNERINNILKNFKKD